MPKLHQNRIVVLGYDYHDAQAALANPVFRDTLERPVLVAAEAHELTISGSVAGLHVATVYATPAAHRGRHYGQAMEALERCLARTGGKVIVLDEAGGLHASV